MSDSRKQWLLKVIAGPHQGAEISLDEGKALVGSDDACDVVLHDVMIAPQHMELEFGNTGTTAAPMGGRVFLNGKRIKDARQTVPDFTFISIGGSHLVVGPEGAKWPLLSAADVPELEKDAPEPPPAETAAAAPTAPPAPAPAAVEPLPARRRMAWVGVVLGCLLLAAWLIGWKLYVGDMAKDKGLATTPVERAKTALKELGVAGRIKLEESSGGRVDATGYVDTDPKQREVQTLLRELVPGIRIRVWSLEKVATQSRDLIAKQKVALLVSSLQEGEVKVSGMMASTDEWERVRQLLLTEIPGLSGIDDQVRITPGKAPVTQPALAPVPATKPSMVTIVQEVAAQEPGLPAVAAAIPVDHSEATIITITSSSDGLGWLRISTGSVYFTGAQLPAGGTVIGISKDAVSVMDNGKKRELRRGQRLGGDEVLQTTASPAQITPAPIP